MPQFPINVCDTLGARAHTRMPSVKSNESATHQLNHIHQLSEGILFFRNKIDQSRGVSLQSMSNRRVCLCAAR